MQRTSRSDADWAQQTCGIAPEACVDQVIAPVCFLRETSMPSNDFSRIAEWLPWWATVLIMLLHSRRQMWALSWPAGADIAMEAGDATLMRTDLTGVATAIALSRGTNAVIPQNLLWALTYNGIPLAAGALYPVYGLLLSPVLVSAAMALS
jgi:hypothetical protein